MPTIFSQYAWIVPLLPLMAFLFVTALGRPSDRTASLSGGVASVTALILSILILMEQLAGSNNEYSTSFTWFKTGSFSLTLGIEVTPLTSLILTVVSLIFFLVQLFSYSYMQNDDRAAVFHGYLSLLAFAMFGLVLSVNLLTLFVGWQLLGVAVMLLTGFWYDKEGVREAVKKIFIMSGIGDAALLLALMMLYWYMPEHTLDFSSIQNVFEGQSTSIALEITTLIAGLLLVGAAAKSGLFPFHIWLRHSAKGPLPAISLIHTVTLVPAGFILIIRTFNIVQAAPLILAVMAWAGAIAALIGAIAAMVQNNLIKLVVYSSASQLGLIFLAIGVHSLEGAVYQFIVHAFANTALFLVIGTLVQGGFGYRQSGQRSLASILVRCVVVISLISLSGLPPFPGFWSIKTILGSALDQQLPLFAAGLAAVMLTTMYSVRFFILLQRQQRGSKAESGANAASDSQSGSARLLQEVFYIEYFFERIAVCMKWLGSVIQKMDRFLFEGTVPRLIKKAARLGRKGWK